MMLLVAAFVVVANVGDSRIGRRGSQPGSDVAALQLQPTRTLHKSKQEMRTTGIILVRYLIEAYPKKKNKKKNHVTRWCNLT